MMMITRDVEAKAKNHVFFVVVVVGRRWIMCNRRRPMPMAASSENKRQPNQIINHYIIAHIKFGINMSVSYFIIIIYLIQKHIKLTTENE